MLANKVIQVKRLYYGWVMVALAVIGLAICALPTYIFGVFMKPLTTEFRWERGALSLALSLMAIVSGLLSIVAGRVSDKYGPRFVVTANGILTAMGFCLMSRVDSLWQVYLIWGLLLGVGGSGIYLPN